MNELKELFVTAFDYLKRLMRGVDGIIENMPEKTAESLNTLGDALEGLSWLAEALAAIEPLTGFKPDIPGLKGQLFEMTSAIENADYSYLVEFLENETMPLLCDWYDALEEYEEKQGAAN